MVIFIPWYSTGQSKDGSLQTRTLRSGKWRDLCEIYRFVGQWSVQTSIQFIPSHQRSWDRNVVIRPRYLNFKWTEELITKFFVTKYFRELNHYKRIQTSILYIRWKKMNGWAYLVSCARFASWGMSQLYLKGLSHLWNRNAWHFFVCFSAKDARDDGAYPCRFTIRLTTYYHARLQIFRVMVILSLWKSFVWGTFLIFFSFYF